ncbi:hypothetical protein [Luteimonas sp. gir]|uniref:hypothetical protein n=1 Tax=Luteimonas sp. gir TaxID=3127960 RepID=UPI003075CA03
MVFVFLFAALLVVWSLGAVLLWHDTPRTSDALAWVAGLLALATAAAFGVGLVGLVRYGDWEALTTAQALHAVFGEGSLALRRSEWGWLNRLSGVYLGLDLGWTLLMLCAAQFASIGFWSTHAQRRRASRRGRPKRD